MHLPALRTPVSEGRDGVGMDIEARRLVWRCRRGLKELDVLLERHVSIRLAGASEQERRTLEKLLDLPDPELAGYLLGGRLAEDPELAALIERILALGGAVKRTTIETGSVAPHESLGA